MAANDNQNFQGIRFSLATGQSGLKLHIFYKSYYTYTGYQPILHQLIKNKYAYTIYMEGATANKLDELLLFGGCC